MGTEGGTKFDQDPLLKPAITLVPLKAIWEVAKVMTFGAKKYDKFNWLGGIKYTRLADAAMRHIVQFMNREDIDNESGLSHLAHAGCCILMLLEMTIRRPDMDDRYTPNTEEQKESKGEKNGKTTKATKRTVGNSRRRKQS